MLRIFSCLQEPCLVVVHDSLEVVLSICVYRSVAFQGAPAELLVWMFQCVVVAGDVNSVSAWHIHCVTDAALCNEFGPVACAFDHVHDAPVCVNIYFVSFSRMAWEPSSRQMTIIRVAET